MNGVLYLGAQSGCGSAPCVAVTTFGNGSVTQILPDSGGLKVLGSGSSFTPSQINVSGDVINVLDGATIYAPSGTVALSAQMSTTPAIIDPTAAGFDPVLADDTRIYLGQGARLDVSGLSDVQVAMEQNVIQAELRANELRDNPVLQNSPLRGKTVYFDVREGAGLVSGSGAADLGGYVGLLERDVTELMTSGGLIALKANVVIARQGSTIDLSGGSLQYLPGYLKSTLLVDASGQRVSIEQAQKGVAYVGIDGDFVVNHSRWGVTETYASALSRAVSQYEPGYEQGGSAGTLTIGTNTPSWYAPLAATTDPYPQKPSATGFVRILDGSIVATTVVGPYQRELPSSTVDPTDFTQSWRYQPKGASLGLTESGDVSFASAVSPLLGEDFGPQSAIPSSAPKYELTLPSVWFGGTFKSISIASGSDPNMYATGSDPTADSNGTVERAQGGHLVIPAGVAVDMGEGGLFSFSGKEADIEGTLAAPGGSVSLTALQKDGASTASTGIHLGASAVIDVAGRFTNDNLDGTNQPYQALNGGNVSLTGAEVVLDEGLIVDVSGGARLNATGTTLTAGKGGAIRINVSSYPTPIGDPTQLTEPYPGKLLLGGDLRGYALPPAQDGLPSRGGSPQHLDGERRGDRQYRKPARRVCRELLQKGRVLLVLDCRRTRSRGREQRGHRSVGGGVHAPGGDGSEAIEWDEALRRGKPRFGWELLHLPHAVHVLFRSRQFQSREPRPYGGCRGDDQHGPRLDPSARCRWRKHLPRQGHGYPSHHHRGGRRHHRRERCEHRARGRRQYPCSRVPTDDPRCEQRVGAHGRGRWQREPHRHELRERFADGCRRRVRREQNGGLAIGRRDGEPVSGAQRRWGRRNDQHHRTGGIRGGDVQAGSRLRRHGRQLAQHRLDGSQRFERGPERESARGFPRRDGRFHRFIQRRCRHAERDLGQLHGDLRQHQCHRVRR